MVQDKYRVRLENFEGPLDLLLHLIEKNEIDIYDIPIAKITDQYLTYINEAKFLDLDFASEFLVMAATLLAIKAKMLLPKPVKVIDEDEGEDPREELVIRLIEYKQYKEAASILRTREKEMTKVFTRNFDEAQIIKKFGPGNPVENLTVHDLFQTFKVILEKASEPEPIYEISREKISIRECMVNIMEALSVSKKGLVFTDLFPLGTSRLRIIVTFLALLELIKLNRIRFMQSGSFGRIVIFIRDDEE
ncbi:MAG: segregation and condensation protein [Clostridia bacterium]|jgi:segregation and condensation protein A|nr:segregation and condensation protein [Clostridia bacterium]MDN5322906.1 segregation and condensation protein [Clostridia bacterium]